MRPRETLTRDELLDRLGEAEQAIAQDMAQGDRSWVEEYFHKHLARRYFDPAPVEAEEVDNMLRRAVDGLFLGESGGHELG